MADTQELLDIPGFTVGVRPNAALRRIVLNAPVCPYSQNEYEKDAFGNVKPKDRGIQNCQLEGGQWWLNCVERGHDPYFTSKTRYTIEDVYTTDDEGREIKTGEQRIAHRERRPNLVSVPLNRRINNGTGVIDSMQKKGRRRLKDAGYYEVCQFRNCQRRINPKYHSIPYGDYCSKEHFELSIANETGALLPHLNGKLNAGSEEKIQGERRRLLAQAAYAAKESE